MGRGDSLMAQFPSRANVERTKALYPQGTRIQLISMDDPYSKLKAGDRATVKFVDDAAQIHCRWDNGSGLALIPNEDSFRKLTQQEIEEEQIQSASHPEQDINMGM